MAAAVCQPLKDPEFYTPQFRIRTYLRHPLHIEPDVVSSGTSSVTLSLSDSSSVSSRKSSDYRAWCGFSRRADVFSTLFTLELLCRVETESLLYQRTKCPSRFFQSEASVLVSYLQSERSVTKSMRSTSRVFPDSTRYLTCGSLPKTPVRSQPDNFSISGYFETLATVHQLTSLASQINSDISALPTHKYIPHQLAVLHTTLSEKFSDSASSYRPYKHLIEERFDSLKSRLKENDSMLIPNHEHWLMELTSDLVEYTETIPPEVNDMVADILLAKL